MRVGLRSGSEGVIASQNRTSTLAAYTCTVQVGYSLYICAIITVGICAQAGLPQISVYVSWRWGHVLIPVCLSKKLLQADSSVHLMWQLTPVREWQVWSRNKETQMQPKSPEKERKWTMVLQETISEYQSPQHGWKRKRKLLFLDWILFCLCLIFVPYLSTTGCLLMAPSI